MSAELPADQRLLLEGLLSRLDLLPDSAALAHFMSEVLRSLLRRQGDAEFREMIQTAFADGLVAHTWEEQKALAAEVIRVVIVKRPEIALAWQRASAAPPPSAPRRAADVAVASPPASPPTAPPPENYIYAEAETGLGLYIADIALRRLAQIQVPPAALPSAAYHSARPFFLFDPALAEVLRAFIAGPLLRYCRDGMDRRVYRPCEGAVPVGDEAWTAYMADKRDVVWASLLERLTRLAAAHKSAETKQAAVQDGDDPGYRVVEVPVTKPRHYTILGVEFTLGHVTTTRKVKVRTPSANALEPNEQEALDLLAELRTLAEQARLDLPDSVDFQFLRTLLDYNVRQFVAARDELMSLIGQGTSGPFLLERLRAIDDVLSNVMADILGLMLFTRYGDRRFGLSDFYYFCQGAARDFSAVGNTRPFSVIEIASRPRELVLQLREALRRRVHPDKFLSVVEKLLECWTVVGRARFGEELDQGLAMFESFAPLFADDPDREVIAEIARMVRGQLVTSGTSRESLLLAVGRAYEPIGRRSPGRH
ncbi:hypothetical protein [Magnetospirillum molischianum]|uniref:Uncharacterized protein n=1 Tax=Magnetospirillum molischianum DSM 120 TaxID=1150626 RepID=H8FUQ1_MAGML|nr:hypothetical protein [Magnetospirillum molischianum]CCG42089.1 conserved hypothetical protein [Magnetospirillum molischianum DSM 120]